MSDQASVVSSSTTGGEGTAITVVVRLRPPNSRELAGPQGELIQVVDEKLLVYDPPGERVQKMTFLQNSSGRAKNLTFGFDRVFGPESTQEDVFSIVKETIFPEEGGLLDGFNCTVFAYGATGSGKTFSMAGTEENPGIMSRSVQQIFEAIETRSGRSAKLRMSYLEIYNEEIRDLLVTPAESKKEQLKIVDDPHKGITVTGLTFLYPKDTEEVLQLVQIGNSRRTQAQTEANPVSSRSHAVLQIVVENCDDTPGIESTSHIGKLSLIDLAGSERATQNTGDRLRETTKINGSLLALSNCINMLCKNSSYIPFRQSKLTRLLKDSLGGNCKTICLSCISPSYLSYDDTFNTLQYANKAKNIKTNVSKNSVNVKAHITEYQAMIERLREQVKTLQSQAINVPLIDSFKRSIDPAFTTHKRKLESLVAQHRSDSTGELEKAVITMSKSDIRRKLQSCVNQFVVDSNKKRPSDPSTKRWIDLEQRVKQLELENMALKATADYYETEMSLQKQMISSKASTVSNNRQSILSTKLSLDKSQRPQLPNQIVTEEMKRRSTSWQSQNLVEKNIPQKEEADKEEILTPDGTIGCALTTDRRLDLEVEDSESDAEAESDTRKDPCEKDPFVIEDTPVELSTVPSSPSDKIIFDQQELEITRTLNPPPKLNRRVSHVSITDMSRIRNERAIENRVQRERKEKEDQQPPSRISSARRSTIGERPSWSNSTAKPPMKHLLSELASRIQEISKKTTEKQDLFGKGKEEGGLLMRSRVLTK